MNIIEPIYFYTCERCGHMFNKGNIGDMKRHLRIRKNQCENKKETTLDDNEIYKKSIERKYYKNSIISVIEKYKELSQIENNKKNNEKNLCKCNFCFNIFSTKTNMERHLSSCKIKKIIDDENNKINKKRNDIIGKI